MVTLTSRTKNNNNSDNKKNTSNGIAPSAALPSPVTQLFREDQSVDDFKQENGSLATKDIHSFGEIGIPPNNNSGSKQLKSSPSFPAIQRKSSNINAQKTAPNNKTGLPNNLKLGVEQLSGISLDDVKVHYNSKEPKQLKAHAYAKGTDIHVASGQEQHLPHEAWHVVQQKQGRVQATTQLKGNVNINDNASLENEATQMGKKALNNNIQDSKKSLNKASIQTPTAQLWSWGGLWGSAKEKGKKVLNDEVLGEVKDEFSLGNKAGKQLERFGNMAMGKGNEQNADPGQDAEGSFWSKIKKPGKYYEDESDDHQKHKGGFMKGAVGGALGTVGGLAGGVLGGLAGGAKGAVNSIGNGINSLSSWWNGKPNTTEKKPGFFESMWSGAKSGGKTGRDIGRVAGSGIVDGTKALAGGAAGLATGAAGGVVGALGGVAHGAYNKYHGKGDFFDTVKKDAKAGAKGGFNVGKGVVDAGFGLVEEAPELAMNLGRGALGAAGGVVGALGGVAHGAYNKYHGKGDFFDTVGKDAKAGANFGANSNLTRNVLGTAAVAGSTLAGGLLGGPAGLAAGYTAAHANSRYWGASKSQADISALVSTAGGAASGLINADLPGLGNAAIPEAAYYSAKGAATLGNVGTGVALNQTYESLKKDNNPDEVKTDWGSMLEMGTIPFS